MIDDPATLSSESPLKNDRREPKDRRLGDRRAGFDRRMPERSFAPDEYIFKEGEAAKLCYQIVSGKVGIYKHTQGEYKEIVEFKEGDMFGEMALIDNSPRRATAQAKEATVVKQIHQRAFLDYLSQSPEITMSIMKRLIAYARTSMDARDMDSFTMAESVAIHEADSDDPRNYIQRFSQRRSGNQLIIDEYQSPAEALLRKKQTRGAHWSLWGLCVLALTAIVWAFSTGYQPTINSAGMLISSVNAPVLTSQYNGQLNSLSVQLGDKVNKGDVLARIITTKNISTNIKSENDSPIMKEVYADFAGIVTQLGKFYQGADIQAGDVLMKITPVSAPMLARIDLSAYDIAQVRIGGQVTLTLPALPSLGHGYLEAEIVELVHNSNKSTPNDAYVHAMIKDNHLRRLPQNFYLVPETPIQASIHLEKRVPITYLFEPFLDPLSSSLTKIIE